MTQKRPDAPTPRSSGPPAKHFIVPPTPHPTHTHTHTHTPTHTQCQLPSSGSNTHRPLPWKATRGGPMTLFCTSTPAGGGEARSGWPGVHSVEVAVAQCRGAQAAATHALHCASRRGGAAAAAAAAGAGAAAAAAAAGAAAAAAAAATAAPGLPGSRPVPECYLVPRMHPQWCLDRSKCRTHAVSRSTCTGQLVYYCNNFNHC